MTSMRTTGRRLRERALGPYVPAHRTTLAWLLGALLPGVVVLLVLLEALESGDAGAALRTGLLVTLVLGAQLVVGTTAVFALLERRRRRYGGAASAGSPAGSVVARESGRAGAAVSAAGHAAVLVAIVWQHVARPYRVEGALDGIPVLAPDLWPGPVAPILAGLAGIVVFRVLQAAGRARSVAAAVGYAVAELLVALPLASLLLAHRVFHPDVLVDVGGFVTPPETFYTGVAVGVVVASVLAVVGRFRSAARAAGAGQ